MKYTLTDINELLVGEASEKEIQASIILLFSNLMDIKSLKKIKSFVDAEIAAENEEVS